MPSSRSERMEAVSCRLLKAVRFGTSTRPNWPTSTIVRSRPTLKTPSVLTTGMGIPIHECRGRRDAPMKNSRNLAENPSGRCERRLRRCCYCLTCAAEGLARHGDRLAPLKVDEELLVDALVLDLHIGLQIAELRARWRVVGGRTEIADHGEGQA